MKHKRELTVRLDDGLNVAFTDATAETGEDGVKRKESETSPAMTLETVGALAQAVGLRLGSFFGESAPAMANLFEAQVERVRRETVETSEAVSPDRHPSSGLVKACWDFRAARMRLEEESKKPVPDIPAITAIEEARAKATREIDSALAELEA